MDYLKTLYGSVWTVLAAYMAVGPDVGHAQGVDRETLLWNEARATGSLDAFQRYLKEYPVGRYASDAFRCIVEDTIGGDGCSIEPGAGPAGARTLSRGINADLY